MDDILLSSDETWGSIRSKLNLSVPVGNHAHDFMRRLLGGKSVSPDYFGQHLRPE
jgi:hypothetical protein